MSNNAIGGSENKLVCYLLHANALPLTAIEVIWGLNSTFYRFTFSVYKTVSLFSIVETKMRQQLQEICHLQPKILLAYSLQSMSPTSKAKDYENQNSIYR